MSIGTLRVSTNRLLLRCWPEYWDFRPEQVWGLKTVQGFFPLSSGVQIGHSEWGYPDRVLFTSISPEEILKKIYETGFVLAGKRKDPT